MPRSFCFPSLPAESIPTTGYTNLDLELADGYGIYEFLVPRSWIGKSIGELNVRSRYRLNILAVRSGTSMVIAVGTEYVFEHNQIVIALGSQEDIRKCLGQKVNERERR